MPTFDDVTTSSAPVEEVWKLLYDPSRFPEWWEGVETIEAPRAEPTDGDGTRIGVHVEIPDAEAHRLDAQRGMVSASLRSLAALANATDGPPGPG
jgi:uncharacterized protein YndB with AHSA1/START domain